MKSILKNSNGNAVSTGGKLLGVTEGYVKPSGTKEITDTNLTDVTSYANAQVVDSNLTADNIKKDIAILGVTGTFEGGSSSGSLEGLQELENSIISTVNNQKAKLTPTYNKKYDTTENITIYTPNEQCKTYYIAQNTGGYRIIWTTTNIVTTTEKAIKGLDKIKLRTIMCSMESNRDVVNEGIKLENFSVTVYYNSVSVPFSETAYYSSYYTNVEECIEAIKSNTIIYTKANINVNFGGTKYNNTGTPIVITNGIYLGEGDFSSLTVNNGGRQLSTNETIMVIE